MFVFLKYFLNPSTIALLLGGILTSLFGFLAAISKEERTPKWIAWGAFLAGLLVLFAGVLSGYQQDITSKLIQNRTEKIANLSQENAKFAKINAKLNKKIADSITGGDGFCYYQVGFPYGTKNKLSGFLMHVGASAL